MKELVKVYLGIAQYGCQLFIAWWRRQCFDMDIHIQQSADVMHPQYAKVWFRPRRWNPVYWIDYVLSVTINIAMMIFLFFMNLYAC